MNVAEGYTLPEWISSGRTMNTRDQAYGVQLISQISEAIQRDVIIRPEIVESLVKSLEGYLNIGNTSPLVVDKVLASLGLLDEAEEVVLGFIRFLADRRSLPIAKLNTFLSTFGTYCERFENKSVVHRTLELRKTSEQREENKQALLTTIKQAMEDVQAPLYSILLESGDITFEEFCTRCAEFRDNASAVQWLINLFVQYLHETRPLEQITRICYLLSSFSVDIGGGESFLVRGTKNTDTLFLELKSRIIQQLRTILQKVQHTHKDNESRHIALEELKSRYFPWLFFQVASSEDAARIGEIQGEREQRKAMAYWIMSRE